MTTLAEKIEAVWPLLKDATISNVRPLSDRLLVRRADALKQSKGGIWIPDNAKKASMKGLVLAVGPGKLNEKTGARTPLCDAAGRRIQKGDTILFTKHAGFWGKLDDHEEVLILLAEDVLAVVDGDAEVGPPRD